MAFTASEIAAIKRDTPIRWIGAQTHLQTAKNLAASGQTEEAEEHAQNGSRRFRRRMIMLKTR